MGSDQHIWKRWAEAIQRWGMQEWLASVLEASGPLTVLGAQLVYFGQPFLKRVVPEAQMDALAHMLEDSNQSRAFATFLRKGTSE